MGMASRADAGKLWEFPQSLRVLAKFTQEMKMCLYCATGSKGGRD